MEGGNVRTKLYGKRKRRKKFGDRGGRRKRGRK